ncbi:hypothetical protein M0R19_04595 [Candidatus Pacearchaeota archaeon]|jgi:ribosomal protein L30E|nr:hypothetical protein [Candidatus Pacearchaeota archaeon]
MSWKGPREIGHPNPPYRLPQGVFEKRKVEALRKKYPGREVWLSEDGKKGYVGKHITKKLTQAGIKLQKRFKSRRNDAEHLADALIIENWLSEKIDAKEEKSALNYIRNSYDINSFLRNNKEKEIKKSPEEVLEHGKYVLNLNDVSRIDNMISKSKTPKDLILYRNIPHELAEKLKIGGKINDYAFTSASLSRKIAERFAEEQNTSFLNRDSIDIMEIKISKGRNVLNLEQAIFPELKGKKERYRQMEFLLPRKSNFKINSIVKEKQGHKTIYVELL